MSDLDAFIQAVETDKSLQAQIKAVVEPEEIVQIAQSNNYKFTIQELKTMMLERMGLLNLFFTVHKDFLSN